MSQALGLSEATVRVHLFRAIRKLRRLLGATDEGEATPSDDRLIELCMLDALALGEQQHLSGLRCDCDARRVRLQRLLDEVSVPDTRGGRRRPSRPSV